MILGFDFSVQIWYNNNKEKAAMVAYAPTNLPLKGQPFGRSWLKWEKQVFMMDMTQKIKIILNIKKMTIKDLAQVMNKEPHYLYLSENDLHAIAEALDCDYDGIFTLRDTGKQI